MGGKLFIIKLVVFGVLNLSILAVLLYCVSGRHRDIRLSYAESESNLLVTGKNEHYPVVFLGTSRGRVLSRMGIMKWWRKSWAGRLPTCPKGAVVV